MEPWYKKWEALCEKYIIFKDKSETAAQMALLLYFYMRADRPPRQTATATVRRRPALKPKQNPKKPKNLITSACAFRTEPSWVFQEALLRLCLVREIFSLNESSSHWCLLACLPFTPAREEQKWL